MNCVESAVKLQPTNQNQNLRRNDKHVYLFMVIYLGVATGVKKSLQFTSSQQGEIVCRSRSCNL